MSTPPSGSLGVEEAKADLLLGVIGVDPVDVGPVDVDTRSNTTPDSGARGARDILVLDTSVLVSDPAALNAYAGCDIVIPLTVIEELDGLKTRTDDVGRSARSALRAIEALRQQAGGTLAQPIALPNGASVRIEVNGVNADALSGHGLEITKPDNRIIGAALGVSGLSRLVSQDTALRIKAAHLGVSAREHAATNVLVRSPGWCTVEVSGDLIDTIYQTGRLDMADIPKDVWGTWGLVCNEFIVLRAGSQSGLVRFDGQSLVRVNEHSVFGLRGRSKEQRFALDLLMDPGVAAVALDGKAGTGKTLLALAAGLELVVERRALERVSVFRPIVPVGRAELGYLPGDLNEKLEPWMGAIQDAIVALTETRSHHDAQNILDEALARRQLTLESVTFLRGRTLHRSFIIVDEAQNLEPPVLKTILTRVGEGSKVVFTGDTSQLDNPFVSSSNNALSVLIDRFGGQSLFGHVELTACERSELADLAADLL